MRNQHGGNLVGIDTLAFERNQAGRAAVQQNWRLLTGLHDDTGLQASAASERITGSRKGHRDAALARRRHRTHHTSLADRISAPCTRPDLTDRNGEHPLRSTSE